MPVIRRLFLDHPATVNESYWQHMGQAAGFGWAMLRGSLACFVHALVPALCVRTGSRIIGGLHHRMVTHRVAQPRRASRDEALLWMAADI